MAFLSHMQDRFAEGLKSFPFAGSNALGLAGGRSTLAGAWSDFAPGSPQNYAALAGPLWKNSAVAACINWMVTAYSEAPICVKEKNAEGKLIVVPNDRFGLTALLEDPTPDYDDSVLLAGTLTSWNVDGNVYWFIVRDRAGRPAQLWYRPHFMVEPRWNNGDFISYYDYTVDGKTQRVKKEDVIHLRFGIDPQNERKGMAPLAAVAREVFSDNEATNYGASILKNVGVVGAIASPRNPEDTIEDTESFAKLYQSKTTGSERGKLMVFSNAMDILFPNNSPDKMALDTIRKYPEARICAVMGLSAMVVGLNVGLERSTFSNYEEARLAAWEDCVLPTMKIIGKQATKQLLRANYAKPGAFSIGFDISNVRVLQPDEDEIHARWREDFSGNLVKRSEARAGIGLESGPDDDIYYADIAPPASGGFDGTQDAAADLLALPRADAPPNSDGKAPGKTK